MLRRSYALGLALALLCGTAMAAKAAKWPNEPKTFMGITIDGSPSNVHGCSADAQPDSPPCQLTGTLFGLPFIGFSVDGNVSEFEDKVVWITLTFDHDDVVRMAQILIQRYGKPTQFRKGKVTSVMGVGASDEHMIWDGEVVRIELTERDDSLTKSRVLVTNKAVQQDYQADYDRRNGQPADKL